MFNPCAKVGNFIPQSIARVNLEAPSPSGKTKVVIVRDISTGAILDIELIEIGTHTILFSSGAIPSGASAGWGYSPDGSIFLFASSATLSGVLVLAEGSQAGNIILNFSYVNQTNVVWGFGPDNLSFVLIDTDYITLYDLKVNNITSISELTSSWGQWRFSPCGDLFVLISTQNNGPVIFYQLPHVYSNISVPTPWQATSKGNIVSLTVDISRGNPGLTVISQGVNGIQLTGLSTDYIDNPIPI